MPEIWTLRLEPSKELKSRSPGFACLQAQPCPAFNEFVKMTFFDEMQFRTVCCWQGGALESSANVNGKARGKLLCVQVRCQIGPLCYSPCSSDSLDRAGLHLHKFAWSGTPLPAPLDLRWFSPWAFQLSGRQIWGSRQIFLYVCTGHTARIIVKSPVRISWVVSFTNRAWWGERCFCLTTRPSLPSEKGHQVWLRWLTPLPLAAVAAPSYWSPGAEDEMLCCGNLMSAPTPRGTSTHTASTQLPWTGSDKWPTLLCGICSGLQSKSFTFPWKGCLLSYLRGCLCGRRKLSSEGFIRPHGQHRESVCPPGGPGRSGLSPPCSDTGGQSSPCCPSSSSVASVTSLLSRLQSHPRRWERKGIYTLYLDHLHQLLREKTPVPQVQGGIWTTMVMLGWGTRKGMEPKNREDRATHEGHVPFRCDWETLRELPSIYLCVCVR